MSLCPRFVGNPDFFDYLRLLIPYMLIHCDTKYQEAIDIDISNSVKYKYGSNEKSPLNIV